MARQLPVRHRSRAGVRALLVFFALAGPVASGWAQPQVPSSDATRVARERERIQAERERLEARFAAEQAQCSERFAVTACVDDVRQRRRAALAAPRAQALALDDAERRERAAARRQAVQDKQRRAAETPTPARPQPAAARAAAAPAPAPPSSAAGRAAEVPRGADAAASAAASQRAAASRLRQQDIKAGQARIEAREAARKRSGNAAAPLPTPATAASAAKPGRR